MTAYHILLLSGKTLVLISQAQWGLLESISWLLMLPLIRASFPHLFACLPHYWSVKTQIRNNLKHDFSEHSTKNSPPLDFLAHTSSSAHIILIVIPTKSHTWNVASMTEQLIFFFILLKLNNHMWLVVVQGSEALDYSNSAAFIAVVLSALSCPALLQPHGL